MGRAFETTEQIGRPVGEVWDRLTDWDRAPEWMRGVDHMEADGPTEVGTELSFRARGKTRPSTITALDPGRSVTLTSTQGRVTANYSYACRPTDEGTEVTLVAECRTEGVVMGAVAPLLRFVMRRVDGGQVAALKQVVESG